jgi:hypothetical protein
MRLDDHDIAGREAREHAGITVQVETCSNR